MDYLVNWCIKVISLFQSNFLEDEGNMIDDEDINIDEETKPLL